jgi:hypothetical protein
MEAERLRLQPGCRLVAVGDASHANPYSRSSSAPRSSTWRYSTLRPPCRCRQAGTLPSRSPRQATAMSGRKSGVHARPGSCHRVSWRRWCCRPLSQTPRSCPPDLRGAIGVSLPGPGRPTAEWPVRRRASRAGHWTATRKASNPPPATRHGGRRLQQVTGHVPDPSQDGRIRALNVPVAGVPGRHRRTVTVTRVCG